MRKWLTTCGIFLLMISCVHKLALDPSPPAADSNYATAEYQINGTVAYGLSEVFVEVGELYDTVDLRVQGYFDGVIKVDSRQCGVSVVVPYKDSALVPIKIPGMAFERTCLIDIVVIPVFPGEKDQGILTYEFKGQLMIKPLGRYMSWYGTAHNARAGEELLLGIPMPTIGEDTLPPEIAVAGCGGTFSGYALYNEDIVMLALSDIVQPGLDRQCIFEGVVLSDSAILAFTWRVWSYDLDFVALPAPRLEIKNSMFLKHIRKVTITGVASVGYIAMDDEYVQGNKASFSYDIRKDHTLRLLTVKGRSVVCIWLIEEEIWGCLT